MQEAEEYYDDAGGGCGGGGGRTSGGVGDSEGGSSYADVLNRLANLGTASTSTTISTPSSSSSLRLAAVTSALIEVVAEEEGGGGGGGDAGRRREASSLGSVSASKIYAKAVPALEATLRQRRHRDVDDDGEGAAEAVAAADAVDSLATQAALLELLEATVPHVQPTGVLVATLPLLSRAVRAVVTSTVVEDGAAAAAAELLQQRQQRDGNAKMRRREASESVSFGGGGGGANAVLRRTCRVATEVLLRCCCCSEDDDDDDDGANNTKFIGGSAGKKEIDRFFAGTILRLFRDRRPKVRKAAHGAAMELLAATTIGDSNDDGGGGGIKGTGRRRRGRNTLIRDAVTQYAYSSLKKVTRQLPGNPDGLGDCLHLLGFLENAVLRLDDSKLGPALMELFAALGTAQVGAAGDAPSASSSTTTNYVDTKVKVREETPKVLTIVAVLATVVSMLRDASPARERRLDAFAPRVLASLLQANPALVFRTGRAELDILQRGRVLFGQAVVASCSRISGGSDSKMACTMLPLATRMIVLLAKPADEAPEDPTVAGPLMVDLTQLFRSSLASLIDSRAEGLEKCLEAVLEGMTKVFDPVYRPVWSVSLQALVVLMQQLALAKDARGWRQLQLQLRDSVNSLLDLRHQVPAGSPSQHSVEAAFSSLVQGVGIEMCWHWIEWQHQQQRKQSQEGTCSFIDPVGRRLSCLCANVLTHRMLSLLRRVLS